MELAAGSVFSVATWLPVLWDRRRISPSSSPVRHLLALSGGKEVSWLLPLTTPLVPPTSPQRLCSRCTKCAGCPSVQG